ANPAHAVYVCNRTPAKAQALATGRPNVRVMRDARTLAGECECLFLCTKAADAKEVLAELAPVLTPGHVLLTTASALSLSFLEDAVPSKWVKVIPSLTQSVHSGVILVSYGRRCLNSDRLWIEELLRDLAEPFAVSEEQIRVASDLTSCGPAFLAFLLQQWAAAAARTGQLSTSDAETLLVQMLVGLAALLQNGQTLQDIIQRVAVPGGVTEAGLVSMGSTAAELFDQLHQATQLYAQGSSIVAHLSG
ncbi:MAG: NAD(P)-binding domain-containing protein, partial [Alicyclobacillus sp.]|nr:NAD(P)-binding domain-containing protein [Alicyclobacillus sp.]